MSKLEELGLLNDNTVIEIPDEVPEESSGYVPLVQPGDFLFQLPDNMESIWTKIETKNKGTRISAGFTKDNPLTVVQDKKYDNTYKGSPVVTFINNIEYPRGGGEIEVADMFYLIRALEANLPDEEKSVLNNNMSFIEALKKHAGEYFAATLHWEAYCNPNKNIYVREPGETPGEFKTVEAEGTPGCSTKYTSYARDAGKRIPSYVADDDRTYFYERFEESDVHGDPSGCPASLICNVRLGRFKKATR